MSDEVVNKDIEDTKKPVKIRSKSSEAQLISAVKNKNQLEILETLAVIYAEDAIDYAKKARALDEDDYKMFEDLQEKKLKNLLNLQRVNSDIIRLQDKTRGNTEDNVDDNTGVDNENTNDNQVNAYDILKSLPKL